MMKKVLLPILVLLSLLALMFRFGLSLSSQFFNFQEKAGIKIMSEPSGANVFLNDQMVGKTSYENNDLAEGEKDLRLESDAGIWRGLVKLNGGTVTIVNRDLTKEPTTSAGEIMSLQKGKGVLVSSFPAEAGVEIDGKSFGKSPLLADIPIGEHSFVLAHGSYLKRSIRATVRQDFQLILNVDLALSEADLSNVTIPLSSAQSVVVKATPTGFLRVRDKPSIDGQEVARVVPGDELTLLEELTSWDRVRLPNGKEGYVSKSYVEKKTS